MTMTNFYEGDCIVFIEWLLTICFFYYLLLGLFLLLDVLGVLVHFFYFCILNYIIDGVVNEGNYGRRFMGMLIYLLCWLFPAN
jgi:hypothetical protein